MNPGFRHRNSQPRAFRLFAEKPPPKPHSKAFIASYNWHNLLIFNNYSYKNNPSELTIRNRAILDESKIMIFEKNMLIKIVLSL
jgi:hypothetical protein